MKHFKKIALIMLLFTSTIGIYGCGTKSPSNVVESYFEQMKKGDNLDFTNLLNSTLESTEEKDKLSDESSKKLIDSMKELTYTINSEKIDGESATVNIKVNGPDMSKVMLEFMQKSFSTALSQSFSVNKMSEEESNKLYQSILSECLDNITYTERTGDISLTKSDGEWKINSDDSLSTILLGINQSAFSGKTSKNSNSSTEIKEMTLNEPFNVETEDGNYSITMEDAKATEKRNEFSEKNVTKVAILYYSYANESFGQAIGRDLRIDSYAFQVLDDEGNVLDTYPVSDDNNVAKGTPIGGKSLGSVAYGLTTESSNLNVTFVRGSEKVAKIKIPIK